MLHKKQYHKCNTAFMHSSSSHNKTVKYKLKKMLVNSTKNAVAK